MKKSAVFLSVKSALLNNKKYMEFFNNITDLLAKKNICFIGTYTKQPIETLLPEEKKFIAGCILKRQEEFATGRWCARKALEKLGKPSGDILIGDEGEPLWPESICGSITHTHKAFCAAGALSSEYLSIGIDIEDIQRKISDGASKFIVNNDEFEWLKQAEEKKEEYIKLIFCAKESIFKLFYPIIKRRFSFSVISLLPPTKEGHFTIILNKDLNKEFQKGWKGEGIYFSNKEWLLTLSYLTAHN